MALIVKDRIQETTTTTGTGTLTLNGAVTGFQSFSGIGDGNTTHLIHFLRTSIIKNTNKPKKHSGITTE